MGYILTILGGSYDPMDPSMEKKYTDVVSEVRFAHTYSDIYDMCDSYFNGIMANCAYCKQREKDLRDKLDHARELKFCVVMSGGLHRDHTFKIIDTSITSSAYVTMSNKKEMQLLL